MPNRPPPERPPGAPARFVLTAGSALSRIHDQGFAATAFNPTRADRHWGGGRFDGTADDPYPFLYASSDDAGAVSEALLRDLPLDSSGARLLPEAAIAGRMLSRIAPAADLELVSLRGGRDLAAVAQDTWLTKCQARDYGYTRRWAHAIRAWAPWCRGFLWRSRLEEESLAFVFFEDRCPPGCLVEVGHPSLPPGEGKRLDHEPGRTALLRWLERYQVTLSWPATSRSL